MNDFKDQIDMIKQEYDSLGYLGTNDADELINICYKLNKEITRLIKKNNLLLEMLVDKKFENDEL